MNGSTTYFRLYVSLAPEFGFFDYGGRSWSDPKWYHTTPGEFGARASKLYHLLHEGHHDVKLSPGEMRRTTVWLDSMSLFYGVYGRKAARRSCGAKSPGRRWSRYRRRNANSVIGRAISPEG